MKLRNGRHKRLTCAVDVAQHDGGDIDGEDVVAIGKVRKNAGRYQATTYASVKKPTPATIQTLT